MLDTPGLKETILSIMDNLAVRTDNPADAREYFATQLANAMETFVKSGTVKVNVTTTGTASAQTGTGTGSVQ